MSPAMGRVSRNWIGSSALGLPKAVIRGSRPTPSATVWALGRTSLLTLIRPEPEQSRKEWFLPSSLEFTGRAVEASASKTTSGLPTTATRSSAPIRTTFALPPDPENLRTGKKLATPSKERTTSLHPDLVKRILAEVNQDEIVAMARDVITIPTPTGQELQMAQYIQHTLQQLGLNVTWQGVEEGRANVVGRWIGAGGGKNLMFNGHMDTSNTGREDFLTGLGYKPNAVVKDGFLYGLGIYNMKGALVCYTHAVKALQRAGVRLKGDVIIAAVAGEIEKTQWGEFRGKEYRGYGFGTHYLVNHGILPDMCILGEPTDMHLVLEHFGSMWVRISCTGNYVHTAFCEGREEMNSIRRMYALMEAILEWIAAWERKAAFGGTHASVNLGGIRGGHAWRASRTPEKTDLFLDVRVPPTIPMSEARRDIQELFF